MSIFNLNIERKKKTGPITPKYEGTYPPISSCEPPKKELLDPPFNATAARTYAHWKEEEAINTIRNKIWREITDEIKKGGVTAAVTLPLHPRSSMFSYTEVGRACQLLSKNLLSIVKVMAEDFVKNGYQMTIINDIYSDKCYDAAKKEVGVYIDNSFYLDRIQIEISWEEPENVREPYLKIVDHSGALIREMDKDNSEHYVRPKRVFVKTKGELENGDKSD